jgi:hypothetical protein
VIHAETVNLICNAAEQKNQEDHRRCCSPPKLPDFPSVKGVAEERGYCVPQVNCQVRSK